MEIIAIIITITSMLITAIALWFTISSFKKQMQLTFFADYTKRYQEIIINLPENINDREFNYDDLDTKTKNKTLKYMRAYFDLCSEEYHLWVNGNIDKDVWKEWKSGIESSFKISAFNEAWNIINKKDYPDFNKFVKKISIVNFNTSVSPVENNNF